MKESEGWPPLDEIVDGLSRLRVAQRRMKQAGIWSPIPPELLPEMIKQEQDAVQIKKSKGSAVKLVPAEVKTAVASLGKGMPDEWNYLRDGKFIRLDVDIMANKEALLSEVWKVIKDYRDMIHFKAGEKFPPRRSQEKWEIYDRAYKNKKKPRSALSLALKDLGLTNAPDPVDRSSANNKKLNTKARTYQRMLGEAEFMIQAVYPSI